MIRNVDKDLETMDEFKKREVSGNLSVAVDVLIFTVADNHVEVLLEKRDDEPFRGFYALPGALMGVGEGLANTIHYFWCIVQPRI